MQIQWNGEQRFLSSRHKYHRYETYRSIFLSTLNNATQEKCSSNHPKNYYLKNAKGYYEKNDTAKGLPES